MVSTELSLVLQDLYTFNQTLAKSMSKTRTGTLVFPDGGLGKLAGLLDLAAVTSGAWEKAVVGIQLSAG